MAGREVSRHLRGRKGSEFHRVPRAGTRGAGRSQTRAPRAALRVSDSPGEKRWVTDYDSRFQAHRQKLPPTGAGDALGRDSSGRWPSVAAGCILGRCLLHEAVPVPAGRSQVPPWVPPSVLALSQHVSQDTAYSSGMWPVRKLCEDKGPTSLVHASVPNATNNASAQQAFRKHSPRSSPFTGHPAPCQVSF